MRTASPGGCPDVEVGSGFMGGISDGQKSPPFRLQGGFDSRMKRFDDVSWVEASMVLIDDKMESILRKCSYFPTLEATPMFRICMVS